MFISPFKIGKKFSILLLVLLVVGTMYIVHQQQVYQYDEGTIFGTTYHIRYQNATSLKPELEAEMLQVDTTLSMFNEESWLYKWNKGEKNMEVPEKVEYVTNLALRIASATDGAFDPTIAPLVNAWGFGYKKGIWPTEKEVDSLRNIVGYTHLAIENKHLVSKVNGELDFGAIAKGYAVDCVARVLDSKGVENYMVEIGGEVICHGVNSLGKPWQIGIAKPTEESIDAETVISVKNAALATSGNYRNFHIDSLGNKVAHTIDPRIGHPVASHLLSATVKAATCAEADAYATAFMVMGFEKAKDFANKENIPIYFIYSHKDGTLGTYNTIKW